MSDENFPMNNIKAAFAAGKNYVCYQTHSADLETPVSVYLKLRQFFPQAILYESVEKAAGRGRYSLIACDPSHVWQSINNQAVLTVYDDTGDSIHQEHSPYVIESLRTFHEQGKADIPHPLPSMASGLFGYFSYDMVRFFEKLPDAKPDSLNIPDAVMWRPRIVILFDSVYDVYYNVHTLYAADYPHMDMQIVQKKLDTHFQMVNNIVRKSLSQNASLPLPQNPTPLTMNPHISQKNYEDMVVQAKEYIYAGDAFQIVPSQRFSVNFTKDSFDLYRQLRRVNPSPYMFHAGFDGFSLVGASPEILVRVQDEIVTIRPIAGTRPRGKNYFEDKKLEQELLADPKEQAEHLMLLDLGRNDVGRVSDIGTVQVTEEFTVERYSHVMHIVSNVCGKLKQDYDFLDALFSALPAGTVSGAPKIRAMEIINELEPEKRSFYAGGIGYFSADGNGDFALMLRTGLVKDGKLYVQAGAGVVADSVPVSEYQETINKAGALVKAAGLCV